MVMARFFFRAPRVPSSIILSPSHDGLQPAPQVGRGRRPPDIRNVCFLLLLVPLPLVCTLQTGGSRQCPLRYLGPPVTNLRLLLC
jgi:hypothetical protein